MAVGTTQNLPGKWPLDSQNDMETLKWEAVGTWDDVKPFYEQQWKTCVMQSYPSEWQWNSLHNTKLPQWTAVGHIRWKEATLVSGRDTQNKTLSRASEWQWKTLKHA